MCESSSQSNLYSSPQWQCCTSQRSGQSEQRAQDLLNSSLLIIISPPFQQTPISWFKVCICRGLCALHIMLLSPPLLQVQTPVLQSGQSVATTSFFHTLPHFYPANQSPGAFCPSEDLPNAFCLHSLYFSLAAFLQLLPPMYSPALVSQRPACREPPSVSHLIHCPQHS